MIPKSVSILKEIRLGERRVILLPAEVAAFHNAGFTVYVERGAGERMGYPDENYSSAGAELVSTEEAWCLSPFVIKYKCPEPSEYQYFTETLNLGAWFHAEGKKELTRELCRKGVAAYSYEFFESDQGSFPLSVASSEISGKLAVIYGAYHLQSHLGGSGTLLSHVVGVRPPKVLVIGYGNAGGAAARLASALGAEVVVLGRNAERLRRFQATVPSTVRCYVTSPEVLDQELPDTDLVIGALLVSTFDTEGIIIDEHLKIMKPGSMIIDVTAGYGGGYLPTFDRLTSLESPTFERFGVLHCKISTLPAGVHRTTNMAISPMVAPYLINLGNCIFDSTFRDPVSEAGRITYKGQIAHPEVKRHMEWFDALEAGTSNP